MAIGMAGIDTAGPGSVCQDRHIIALLVHIVNRHGYRETKIHIIGLPVSLQMTSRTQFWVENDHWRYGTPADIVRRAHRQEWFVGMDTAGPGYCPAGAPSNNFKNVILGENVREHMVQLYCDTSTLVGIVNQHGYSRTRRLLPCQWAFKQRQKPNFEAYASGAVADIVGQVEIVNRHEYGRTGILLPCW